LICNTSVANSNITQLKNVIPNFFLYQQTQSIGIYNSHNFFTCLPVLRTT